MEKLMVYRNILKDPLVILLQDLMNENNETGFEEKYYALCSKIIEKGQTSILDYIFKIIEHDENIFSRNLEKNNHIEKSVKKAVMHDIKILKSISAIDFDALSKKAGDDFGFLNGKSRHPLTDIVKNSGEQKIYDYLHQTYKENGCGKYRDYLAFTVDKHKKLVPVKKFSPVTMDMISGYESQKQQLIDNTSRFVSGKHALNGLLYGDRGTGKSTAVKSLIPMFFSQKLRLVEIEKDKLSLIPDIVEMLADRGLYFIIFIDDLSFDSNESDYKFLKSAIQGSIYEKPDNILFYVTSNRRNLVKENMAERENEVYMSDHLNEVASLSDRFGLKLFYHKPTKDEFIDIVRHLAQKENVDDIDSMIDEAIMFAMYSGGLNGRSARQFIDTKL
jgi:uncharacterized protein